MKTILTVFLSLVLYFSLQAQTIVPTQTDEIIIDNGASGKADPNDRIRYKVTIQNTGGASGTGTQLNIVPDPRTTFVPGSFRSSPLALPDAYTCTGNVGINIPVGSGLKVNDFDDNTAGLTVTAGTFATTQGGSIMIAADGSFMYTPPPGFTGTDTYAYTLNDGNPVGAPVPSTDLGTVTFTVSNLIWFIDNSSVAATSDGRLTSPFKTLANFNAGSAAAGDVIYIEHTGTDYPGGIVLQNNERLYGEGHTGGANLANVLPFSLAPNSKTLPNINGSRPVITNSGGIGIRLASGNQVNGVNVGNCSGFAIDDNGNVGSLSFNNIDINTTGGGIQVDNGGSIFGTIINLTATGGVNGVRLSDIGGGFDISGTINLSGQSGDAIQVINFAAGSNLSFGGTLTVTAGGANQAVEITNNGGIINFGSGTLSGSSAEEVLINQGSGTITMQCAITNTSGAMLSVTNRTGGSVDFQGNLSHNAAAIGIAVGSNTGGTVLFSSAGSKTLSSSSATAVNLTANTGSIVNFTNGNLAITTTSGTGFNATGGGTISVTGANNTIASTTGVALNIANTTIGAGNVTFKSISANGAPNGIVLNTTGASGGLIVTGTGSTNGSGGTIQNITNRGVSATSTTNLSLSNITFTNANTTDGAPCGAADNSGCNAAIYINTATNATLDNVDISNTAQQGINLREVNGFQLLNSTVINGGAGGQTEESDLYALNLFGTCAINNSSLTVPAERAAVIYNTSKTMALTVNGSTFGMNQTQPLGADGLEIDSYGASNTTIDIVNSNFVQPKTNGLQVITENTSVSSVDITGSTFDPGTGLAAAIDLDVNNTANMKFNIIGNPSIKGKGINIVNVFAFPNATFEGRINNNTVTSNGGSGTGIRVFSQGNGSSKLEVKNNVVTGGDDYGIDVTCQLGTGRLDATVTGNTVNLPSASGFYAIHLLAGNSGSVNTNKVCGNVANNTTTVNPLAIGNFQARSATAGHEILLQGGGTTVATNWNANTNSPLSPTAIISQSGTGIFTFGATCLLPANPLP